MAKAIGSEGVGGYGYRQPSYRQARLQAVAEATDVQGYQQLSCRWPRLQVARVTAGQGYWRLSCRQPRLQAVAEATGGQAIANQGYWRLTELQVLAKATGGQGYRWLS